MRDDVAAFTAIGCMFGCAFLFYFVLFLGIIGVIDWLFL